MAQQTVDQERAAFAWRMVSQAAMANDFAEYVNAAKGMPALVMGSGLMSSLAFFKSKRGAGEIVAQHVTDWLARKLGWNETGLDFSGAMHRLTSGTSLEYMHATEEALEILRWIRHFAAARKGMTQ